MNRLAPARRARTRGTPMFVTVLVTAAVAALVVVLVVVLGGTPDVAGSSGGAPAPGPVAPDPQTRAERCARVTAENAERQDDVAPVSRGSQVVVVLGDSYAGGAFLSDPKRQAWPAPVGRGLDATTYVNAIGGTGFVNGGFCDTQTYASRVPAVLAHAPGTVIVEGGFNDQFRSSEEIAAGADEVLRGLAGVPRVVVVGPSAPLAVRLAPMQRVDGVLRDASRRAGRQFVSVLGWQLPYVADGIHPTADGQQIFAQHVLTALRTGGSQ